MAQPTDTDEKQYGKAYIAASYVKYIESAGARVVPIIYDTPLDQVKSLFNSLNGLLIPGGDAPIDGTIFYTTTKYIYDLAIEAYDNGDYFPIEAHCLGFELMNIITAENYSILEYYDAENLSLALNFYDGYTNSRLFGNADPSIINILSKEKVTLNNHVRGVSPSTYSTNDNLHSFYNLLTWNVDRNNKQFVSSIEGKKYPFYAIQWHAEKPLFEWNPQEAINHSPDSVKAMQYVADFFISEARKSNHAFASESSEASHLIYNYQPTYTAPYSSDFVQVYYFQ
eukprot:TRINITY_DN18335_c0_g1_i1.p1 TRINITY_DN18335_c0_g1~~TRINITY_DN18335_c0_g1_i1.p1  ORF type:complete len:302 (+),score=55.00 TRINITY_DN18335_c0_g1_i1:59-907(+)